MGSFLLVEAGTDHLVCFANLQTNSSVCRADSLQTVPRPAAARDRILDTAERLVLQRGFAATTVDAVLEGAGASKGAFFHHFPTKAALGRALVARYAAADADLLESQMRAAEQSSDDPADQLLAFLRGFESAATEAVEAQPACLFVSFIYEAELTDADTAALVRASIAEWRGRIGDKLRAAAASRPHLAVHDLDAVADHVFATFEGAFLLVRAEGDPQHMARQLAVLRHHIELLLAAPAST